jgi:flagellar biosynthesis chaperone FliJ
MKKIFFVCTALAVMCMLSCGNSGNKSKIETNQGVTTSDKDWKKFLKSYDEMVDQYIKYFKKAAKGDMSALTEYPALAEKIQKLQAQSVDLQNNLTPSDIAKFSSEYMKITQKFMDAANAINE